jgi:hypothetical protein
LKVTMLRLAVTAVLAWTRLYTWRMPPDLRDARRAEIESDVWEFQHDEETKAGLGAAAHLVARLLAGIPDDLLWRSEHPSPRERRLGRTAALTTAGLLLAVLWAFLEVRPGDLPHVPAPPALVSRKAPPPPPPPPPPPRRNAASADNDR